ncbi:MAG: hypothetical protein Q4F41_04455 [Eubacteriales bacterium]|nr:hypothetical protein [Eubacteriales bacterium]
MKKYLPVVLAALFAVSMQTECEGAEQNASEAYTKLIAYKTENYLQQSVADFNAALASTPDELTELLAAQADVINAIDPEDENYDFFRTTMQFSTNELYCREVGEALGFYAGIKKMSRPCREPGEDGERTYDFACFVDFQVPYVIVEPELLTVAERDDTLLSFQEEMQTYLDGLGEAEITAGNFRTMLTDKAEELTERLSDEKMELSSCEISLLEINDAGED